MKQNYGAKGCGKERKEEKEELTQTLSAGASSTKAELVREEPATSNP